MPDRAASAIAVASADAQLHAEGIVNVQRFSQVIAPGVTVD